MKHSKGVAVIALGAALLAVTVISPALGGPSLRKLVKKEVSKQIGKATGPQGQQGSQGQPGPQGSPGASAFSSRQRNNNLGGPSWFAPISGIGPADNSDENAVAMVSPATTIIARDLFARYAGDIGGSGARAFTLRVGGADSSLSCTYTFPAETSCSNTTSAVTIPPGSLLAIRFTLGAGIGAPGDIEVGFRATTP